MATLTVRPETGATIQTGPMVTVAPHRLVGGDELREFASGSGLDGPFLADQFSAFVMHERMGVTLLRTLHVRSDNPMLRPRYSNLADETLQAVDTWEQLIGHLGGNPQYVSPVARTTEALDEKVVESLALSAGSADPLSLEQAGLQVYSGAARQCVVNVRLLAAFAGAAEAGDRRRAMEGAVAALSPAADRHAEWASETLEKMAVQQAKHPVARKVGQAAEKVVGAVRSAVDRTI